MRAPLLLGAMATTGAAGGGGGGGGGGPEFPDATTTGPAAGGYTSLTPVTGGGMSWEWNHTNLLPSYVALQGDGSYLVENIAFGAGTSIFITLASITFRGCSINAAANGIGINFPGVSSNVATGSNGADVTTLTSLAVTDAGGFPSSGGTIATYTSASGAEACLISYTGKSGNTLTGCVYVSGGTGTVTSGSPGPPIVPASAVRLQTGYLNVEYCSISAPDTTSTNRTHACVGSGSSASPVTIDHCDFQWWEQAVQTALTTTITNSYIHDPIYLTSDHTEPVEVPAGTSLIASNSTLTNNLTTGPGAGQTAVVPASILAAPAWFQLDHCLVGGGGYCFYSYAAATNIKVTNCQFIAYYARHLRPVRDLQQPAVVVDWH